MNNVIFTTSIAIGRRKETSLHNCNNKLWWAINLNRKNIKIYTFESRPGHCSGWIWVYYSCGSPASLRWDVKPRSGLRAYAFQIMRGPKSTWMTKQKFRGPEIYRYGRHINQTKAEWSCCTLDTSSCLSPSVCSVETQRVNGLTRNTNKGIAKKKKQKQKHKKI